MKIVVYNSDNDRKHYCNTIRFCLLFIIIRAPSRHTAVHADDATPNANVSCEVDRNCKLCINFLPRECVQEMVVVV